MSKKLYKVSFINQGKVYELYARTIGSSDIWGFVQIADIDFEAASEGIVIDPTEERLRDEFKDTRVLHLPMHAVIRIDEVDRRGALAIRDSATGEKIMPFPLPPKARG
jgi:hypothetical protein